jgi:hypothetical protein
MSGLLAGKVWQSNLDGSIKPLAACLADIANDDGTSIYPSVEYLAWLLGKEPRSVQRGMKKLREMGVLTIVAHAKGGRSNPTEYQLMEKALPKRPEWKETRHRRAKGDKISKSTEGSPELKDDAQDAQRETSPPERVTLWQEKGDASDTRSVSDPLVEPPEEPTTTSTVKGTRVPEDFTVTESMKAWAAKECPDVIVTTGRDEAFIDYWKGIPGAAGRKLDWEATWRNRQRTLQERAQRGAYATTKPPRGRSQPSNDFEFVPKSRT